LAIPHFVLIEPWKG